jgi:hypothetical protein
MSVSLYSARAASNVGEGSAPWISISACVVDRIHAAKNVEVLAHTKVRALEGSSVLAAIGRQSFVASGSGELPQLGVTRFSVSYRQDAKSRVSTSPARSAIGLSEDRSHMVYAVSERLPLGSTPQPGWAFPR